jgi:hypothetical protein
METIKKKKSFLLCWRKHCIRHEFEHDVPFKKGDNVTVPPGFFADIKEENKCPCLRGWKTKDKDPADAETIQIKKRNDDNCLSHSQYDVKIIWENGLYQSTVLCHHWNYKRTRKT